MLLGHSSLVFTGFAVLLTSITFCFDLRASASFKRQTNGKHAYHCFARS
jgi:hypothetical protein